MKAVFTIGAAALALALAGCGGGSGNNATATGNAAAPLTQITAPNHGDWTQIVARTPEGGYRMGNPDAPVKLVEYGSITCPHCAHFSETSAPLRERYVHSGQVSYEFRPFLIHPQDPAVFMLLECSAPSAFFLLSDQLFSTQEQWLGRIETAPQDQLQQLSSLPPQQQGPGLIRLMGLDQFFSQRGMPPARLASCLADNQALQQIGAVTQRASTQESVNQTPTFILNGTKLDESDWPGVEARIRTAMGG
jgi:protein-disulfide isomerase